MTNRMLDRFDDFASRHTTLLSVIGGLWFALTCASYAGFVPLPKIIVVGGWPGMLLSIIWNAAWWGYLYPRAHARRAERTMIEQNNG